METRELRECILSLVAGNAVTLIVFAFCGRALTGAAEIIAYWIGGWYVATYVVWTLIDWLKEKRRDAGQSNHGNGKARIRARMHYSRKGRK